MSPFEQTIMGPNPKCYTPRFKVIDLLFLEKRIFEGFYPLRAWQPSLSCYPYAMDKLSSPLPMEVPHKNWLGLVMRIQRRSLKMVGDDDDGRTDGRQSMGLL